MDQKNIRKRAPNYTAKEKEVLLAIVLKYKDTVENKKTDAKSATDKKRAWFLITQDFNSVSPNNCFRDTDSLKKYYDNIKEDLRKRAGEQRKSLYKTGGGSQTPDKKEECDDLLLDLINNKIIYGLANSLDSDEIKITEQNESQTKVKESEEKETRLEVLKEVNTNNIRNTNDIEVIFEDSISTDSVQDKSQNWTRIKPSDMIKPVNTSLKNNVKATYSSETPSGRKTGKNKQNVSRRRPTTVRVLSSSRLGEMYETLLEKKIQLADGLQKEHELRMTMLRFDIALKKKELATAGLKDIDMALLECPDLMM